MRHKNGIGKHQLDLEGTSQNKIVEYLLDGEWHRYHDMRLKIEMSSATLSKHLKKLKFMVEKKVDVKSGEYPYPVHYRLKTFDVRLYKMYRTIDLNMAEEASLLTEEKQPRLFIHSLNRIFGIQLLTLGQAFSDIQKNETGREATEYFNDLIVFAPLKKWIKKFWICLEELNKTEDLKPIMEKAIQQYGKDYDEFFERISKSEPSIKDA